MCSDVLSFLKKALDYESYTKMAMKFMQTLTGEIVSKGRALQKIPSHVEFRALFPP